MKKKNTLLLNLFAGPGTGKSSTMAGVFSELKWMGVNCEQAPEFAKEKVWEESLGVLKNQIYVFGKQLQAIHRVIGKVDVVITDSPLLLSLIYGSKESKAFKDLVVEVHNSFDNWNIFLNRKKAYNPSGRLQTEKEAKAIDATILRMLKKNDIPFDRFDTGKYHCEMFAKMIAKRIGKDKLRYK
jgi:hypothetical protein